MANAVAYGFINLRNLFAERVSNDLIPTITSAIQASVDEHNRQINSLTPLFAEPVSSYSLRYQQIGANRLQPLDENGRARPVQPAGYYDISYPIYEAGTAWGATFKARELMTVADANRLTAMMLQGDMVWMRDHILAALLAAATSTYTDEAHGTLTVQPLANGDTILYPRVGTLSGSADTHQLAQAAAIADGADPYPLIYNDLVEHPENSGEVIALISSSLVATTKALTSFNVAADPNITYGNASDRLTGTFGTAIPGQLLGYHDAGVWIAEWAAIPAGYILATMTGGDRALGIREYPAASLQGFQRVADREDHPFYETQYYRAAGFGAYNRVGALAYRIGNASYAVPTGFVPPIV